MISLNPMQERLLNDVIDSKKDIHIVATGRGTGQSFVSALLAPILSKDVLIVSKYANSYFDQVVSTLDKCSCSFKCDQMNSRISGGNNGGEWSINTHDISPWLISYFRNHIIIVDHPEMFDRKDINYILNNWKRVIFTTQPIHCGWRNPKYEYGGIKKSSDNSVIYEDQSFDAGLINWKEGRTKASIYDYKHNVNIITGYDVMDNHLLHGQPREHYRMIAGVWRDQEE